MIANLTLAALAAATPKPGAGGGAPTRTAAREMMHTRVTVTVADAIEPGAFDEAAAGAFAVFRRVEEVMNEWRPDSALSRVNAAAGGNAVTVPADLCDVLRLAADGARRTDGLFDPTWAALKDVWRFGSDESFEVPSEQRVLAACARVKWKWMELRESPAAVQPAPCAARLTRPGMRLGLGGIAKGWGVDQAVARLRSRGLKNFFVQAGGDLYAAGRRGDRPWRAAIREPRGPPEATFAMLEVSDAAFSTSGDYERFAVRDGVRYHHLIDLRNCRPATASRSSTVLAATATDAEVLTKATFVLGGEKGLALAASFGAAAVIVDAAGKVHLSQALKAKLALTPSSRP